MHEISLCESLLEAIMDSAQVHHFSTVRQVRLSVGAFAGVEPEALRFSFDVVMRGTLAEGAILEMQEEPGTAWCFDCGETVTLIDRLDPCPFCGSVRLRPNGGMGLIIKDMEVV